jgi:regulator of RNase E activity RraA
MWNSDDELFATMRTKLFPAVVGDVLDSLGYFHQFFPPNVQPLRDDMVVLGRAMPVLTEDIVDEEGRLPAAQSPRPLGLMLDALDSLRKDEVYVCTGASPTYALFGELMATRAQALGANGAVLNGYSRDTSGILTLGFPTFSIGRFAQDQRPRGQVVGYRTTVRIGDLMVAPGDVIFGDVDGVVVVPRAIERDVVAQAVERVGREDLVRTAFRTGTLSACDAVDKYGAM